MLYFVAYWQENQTTMNAKVFVCQKTAEEYLTEKKKIYGRGFYGILECNDLKIAQNQVINFKRKN